MDVEWDLSVVLEWLLRLTGDTKGLKLTLFLKRAPNQSSAIEVAELAPIASTLPLSWVYEEKAELEERVGILKVSLRESRAPGENIPPWGRDSMPPPSSESRERWGCALGIASITFSGWTSAWAAVLLSVCVCLCPGKIDWQEKAGLKGCPWGKVSPRAWQDVWLSHGSEGHQEGTEPQARMATLWVRVPPATTVCEVGSRWQGAGSGEEELKAFCPLWPSPSSSKSWPLREGRGLSIRYEVGVYIGPD